MSATNFLNFQSAQSSDDRCLTVLFGETRVVFLYASQNKESFSTENYHSLVLVRHCEIKLNWYFQ
jgi:hypothetical protein